MSRKPRRPYHDRYSAYRRERAAFLADTCPQHGGCNEPDGEFACEFASRHGCTHPEHPRNRKGAA